MMSKSKAANNVITSLRNEFKEGSYLYTMVENEKAPDQNTGKIISLAIAEVRGDPSLSACTKDSIAGAILACARLGLYPGKLLGQAYFVKFHNSSKGVDECSLLLGYKGMISIALRSGFCKSVTAHCVHEDDYFHYELGLNEQLVHKPILDSNKPVIAAYAIAELASGGKVFTVMGRRSIDKIKGNKKYGIWIDHFEEMAKKTAIRRLFKYLPLSMDMAAANALSDKLENDESQNLHLQTKEGGAIYDTEPAEDSDIDNTDKQANVKKLAAKISKES